MTGVPLFSRIDKCFTCVAVRRALEGQNLRSRLEQTTKGERSAVATAASAGTASEQGEQAGGGGEGGETARAGPWR